MRKSDPRTCRLLHFAANLAECRMYNGVCKTDESGVLRMTMYNPDKRRGENLYAGETLETMLEKYFRLADKAFRLDPATVTAFRSVMWDDRDGAQFLCHPSWERVEAAMS